MGRYAQTGHGILLAAALLVFVSTAGIAPASSATGHSMPLEVTSSIRGRIGTAESPLAGVTITATGGYTTATSDDGTYTLNGLPQGTYTITPTKDDSQIVYSFRPMSRTVTVPPDATEQNFDFHRLLIETFISGSVRTPSGAPIEGVEMMVDNNFTITTDSGGTYAFFAGAGETHQIVPRKPGYSFTPPSRNVSVSSSANDFVGQQSYRVYAPVVRLPCPTNICGAVRIENGGVCCIGGLPGASIDIPVRFQAQSAIGEISTMRIDHAACNSLSAIETAWEPFVTERRYTRTLPAGWSPFAVRAQYQDTTGSVSRIFCAEISLEGF